MTPGRMCGTARRSPADFSALRPRKEQRSPQVVPSRQPPSSAGPTRRYREASGVPPAAARHTASFQLTASQPRHTGMRAGAAERAAARRSGKLAPAPPEDTGSGPNRLSK